MQPTLQTTGPVPIQPFARDLTLIEPPGSQNLRREVVSRTAVFALSRSVECVEEEAERGMRLRPMLWPEGEQDGTTLAGLDLH